MYDTSVQGFRCGALVCAEGELPDVCGEVTRKVGVGRCYGFVEGDFGSGTRFREDAGAVAEDAVTVCCVRIGYKAR